MIELPSLSREEVEGCVQRAKNGPTGLLSGFLSELALAKELESRGHAGAYESCVTQQSRGKARKGPDLLDIDVKSTDAYGSLQQACAKLNLQVKQADVDSSFAAPKFAMVIVSQGKRYLVGWTTLEEMRSGEVCLLGEKREIGRKIPILNLRPAVQLLM